MKRLGVVTGSRAEYGVLRPFLDLAVRCPSWELHLFVAGMHLLETYGKTVHNIEADGFTISSRIEMIGSDGSPHGAANALGKGVMQFADAFEAIRPDLVLVEGDRVEALAAGLAAGYMNIPLAHSGGGDITRTIDNAARHAISMFSSLHFVSTLTARELLLSFGIPEKAVHVVGGLGIDSLIRTKFPHREEVLFDLGLPQGSRYMLVCFHPESDHHTACGRWMDRILAAGYSTGIPIVVTYPNSDPGSIEIIESIGRMATQFPERIKCHVSLGHPRFLWALKYADVLVGNSSSGIYEAPSFGVPVVNVGQRQDGRDRASNVIDCSYEENDILNALSLTLHDPLFRSSLPGTVNPYGDGNSAQRMIRILEERLAYDEH